MMQHELSGLRLNVSRILIPFIACHVPLVAAVAYYAGHDLIWPVVVAAANTGAATLVWFQSPGSQATRMTIGVSMVIMVSILLATCDGAAWQADIHMYYFAALAITAAYCDVACGASFKVRIPRQSG